MLPFSMTKGSTLAALQNVYRKSSCNDPLDILPIDIIQFIYNRLDLVTRCRLTAVSTKWRRTFKTFIVPVPPHKEESPWIVLGMSSSYITSKTYHLLNLSLGTQYKLRRVSSNVDIFGSYSTFMALSSDRQYFLYDPFSTECLVLPVLDDQGSYLPMPFDVTLSCNPSRCENFDDRGRCMVAVAIYLDKRNTLVYVCQVGIDTQWRIFVHVNMEINGMVFHRGKLFGINSKYKRLIIASTSDNSQSRLHHFNIQYPNVVLPKDYIIGYGGYILESDGEVLVVQPLCKSRGRDNDDPSCYFQVFKLLEDEMELGDDKEVGIAKAVEVDDLGDRMLFLGGCPMSWTWTYGQYHHSSGFFKRNCIYNIFLRRGTEYVVARFDLKDHSICKLTLPISKCSPSAYARPFWIAPPLV